MTATLGIHHVTAIASDPQRTLDFYAGGLGLRLVKRTVNFDDPETYHFYFGDEAGTPGSILTFFPWPGRGAGARDRDRWPSCRSRCSRPLSGSGWSGWFTMASGTTGPPGGGPERAESRRSPSVTTMG